MKTLAVLLLASALALPASSAMAADFMEEPMGDGIVVDDSGFDWDRFYATVYAVYVFGDQFTAGTGEGVSVGINQTTDSILYGGTLSAGTFQGGTMDGQFIAQGVVRAGVLATDNVLLYGMAGLGWETYDDALYIPTGLGAEVALSDNLALKLQYQANWVTAQTKWTSSISAALAWYF
jgi:opacity protein-like surface antigen